MGVNVETSDTLSTISLFPLLTGMIWVSVYRYQHVPVMTGSRNFYNLSCVVYNSTSHLRFLFLCVFNGNFLKVFRRVE